MVALARLFSPPTEWFNSGAGSCGGN
jgi:hypothetical protein